MKTHDLISIDPGTKEIGWATWHSGRLAGCGLLKFNDLSILRRMVADQFSSLRPEHREVIVEEPKVYLRGKADPEDILQLAKVAGAVGSVSSYTTFVKPGTWKGQVPKTIHHNRIQKLLCYDEMERVDYCMSAVPAAKKHNVWDAIGLGLYHLQRK